MISRGQGEQSARNTVRGLAHAADLEGGASVDGVDAWREGRDP